MIVDLNLRGKQVLVVGGGHEAARKVEALLSQDCEIIVVAETVCEAIDRCAQAGKVVLVKKRVEEGGFLSEYDRLILVLAVTDDTALNRKIVQAAKQLRCYAYAADDPEISDFSHPSVINLYDTVQVAVSTGGKSPLMAKTIREKAEEIFKKVLSQEDVLQIDLQNRLRSEAKKILANSELRKRFLTAILEDEEINGLLKKEQPQEALSLALKRLEEFRAGG